MRADFGIHAAIVCLALALPAPAPAADKKIEKSFVARPGGSLTVSSDIGDVSITGGASNTVTVKVLLKGRQRDIDDMTFSFEETGKGIEVRGKLDRGFGPFRWSGDLKVDVVVGTPGEFNTAVETAGGDISLETATGTHRLETSGGDVVVSRLKGSVTVETSGGNIRADAVEGTASFETSGGDIIVASARGKVKAETSGGDILVSSIEGSLTAETSGGDVSVRALKLDGDLTAETTGGDVRIAIPSGAPATLDASTFGGEVVCDLPVTLQGKISEGTVRGTLNGGGFRIKAHTMGGDISIRGL